jgi:hypothetical protein
VQALSTAVPNPLRVVPGEWIQHEDSLALLKVVVFHQEMDISSLTCRLLAVHTIGDNPFSPATALELP